MRATLAAFALFVVAGAIACAPTPTDDARSPANALSTAGGSKKYALLMGGGVKGYDEPVDYFTADLNNGYAFFSSHGYETTILYGDAGHEVPAHADGLARMEALYGRRPDSFTTTSYRNALQHLVEVAGEGDEIVVLVTDHGWPNDDNGWPKETDVVNMLVALGAPQGERLDFDTFKPYRDALEAKGARIALFFFTCDSAWSTALATENTCVTTEAGYDKGDGYFPEAMWKTIRTGMKLEESYDAAVAAQKRKTLVLPDDIFDDPRISSRMGHPSAPCGDFKL